MSVRWNFLSPEEKQKFDQYDIEMVKLISKRMKEETADEAEQEIKKLHQSIDLFILALHDKYCASNKNKQGSCCK